jgi:WD40 repeat protein
VAFSPDGKKLAVGGGEHFCTSETPDYTVRLWDAVTGQELHRLRGHGLAVEALAFSPDSRLLASASGDALIRLWELDTGREIRQFRGHQGTVYAVAFAPSGGVLASASVDKTIRLWEVSSGKELRRFGERQGGLYGFRRLAWSADGRVLASALVCGDAVHLWDAATGKVLCCLNGVDGEVNALAISPDGRAVAAGGGVYLGKGAPRICLWDVATGRETRQLTDDFLETECLVFSPDGKVLTAGDRGDGDQTIHQSTNGTWPRAGWSAASAATRGA